MAPQDARDAGLRGVLDKPIRHDQGSALNLGLTRVAATAARLEAAGATGATRRPQSPTRADPCRGEGGSWAAPAGSTM